MKSLIRITTLSLFFVLISLSSTTPSIAYAADDERGEVLPPVVGRRILNPYVAQMLEGYGDGLRWLKDMEPEFERARTLFMIKEYHQCLADVDEKVGACQDAVASAALTVETGCIAVATLASFFTSPLGGGIIVAACSTANAASAYEAGAACSDIGSKEKEKC